MAFANATADPFIGEQANFTLRFDNVGSTESDVGYAPYVDLFMPVTGKDGIAPGTPAPQNTYDGIDLVSATYLGTALRKTPVTLTAAATGVPHPFAKDSSGNPRMLKLADFPGAKAGDKVYVLELPLGSYTPSQPPVDIAVTTTVSNLADVGQALPVIARGGFRYGGDPLDNPKVDPTIVGASATQIFTPSLYRVVKENLAPENETATGPNFKQKYRVSVDVADGQTLTNLKLRDVLPGTLQFVSASLAESNPSDLTPSTTTPGGTLERVLASVVGTAASSDAVLEIEYYVPDVDASTAPVLNANTGDDRSVLNSATASGASWTPLDTRDATVASLPPVTVDAPLLVAKSIATQKSVAGTALPGSLLTYTINFQVSDYFACQNLVLSDLLGDGQVLEGTPTLVVDDGHGAGGGSTTGVFDPANFTEVRNKAGTNAKDEIVFKISDELITRGFSTAGRLVGGLVPDGGGVVPGGTNFGGTTGTITFTARVQDKYDGTVPSGYPQIVANDVLNNTASIAGSLLNVANLVPNGFTEEDGTSASARVPQTSFSKAVYAKNGNSTGNPLAATTLVAAGDTITYRITYTLPNSSFENLKLTDYLPLPLFDVDDVGTAIAGFDAAAIGTAPAAGKWTYGPSDTFHTLTSPAPTLPPAVAMNSPANSVTFNFGTFDDTQNRPSTIDILFTVTASNRPFADNLRLANRATSSANNSGNEQEQGEAIAEVTSSEPELKINKGVVATDNTVANGVFAPGTVGPVPFTQPTGGVNASTRFTGTVTSSGLAATPINSNLAGVDNGDFVTFCIVVENRGSGKKGAYDVVIKDAPPTGLAISGVGVQGINLKVTDGTGNAIPFTTIGTGLFDGGIKLDDGVTGALGRGKDDSGNVVNDGSNIVVITYDMRVLDNVVLAKLTNTGSVENYAAEEGGPDFTGSGSLTDTAVITIGADPLAKTLVGTSIGPTDGSGNNAVDEAVVGEFIDYKITITVPEARMPGAVVTDTLDEGLAFVKLLSTSISPGVTASTPTPSVTNGGRTVKFDFGTISNLNTDNAVTEKIELVYRTVVLNQQVIQGGVKRSNSATLTYKNGTADISSTKRAPTVTIIEPQVKVAKAAVFTSGGGSGTTTGEAGNSLQYTITITNPAGAQASTADAYNLTFSDVLPAAILNATLTSVTGASASLFEIVGGTLRTKAGATFDLGVNATPVVLTVTGTLAQSVVPGEVITNTATAEWTSLDGSPAQLSPYSADAVERTGSLSPAYNDYRASGSADLKVKNIGLNKSIVSTSETDNGVADDSRVVPGEIVRWRLVASIPGSTASGNSLRLVDQLPNGLQFLNDGTAKLAIVSEGGVSSTIYTNPAQAPFVSGTTDIGVTPSFVIPTANILGGPFGDGTDVEFNFGSVVNTEGNDGNQEYAIIEFNALVLNVASNGVTNGVGNSLTNSFRARRDGVLGSSVASAKVTLSEGLFDSATKRSVSTADDVTPADGPFDAGDIVRYRVDVAAAAGVARATLFDVDIVDPLVPDVILDLATIRVLRNGVQINSGFSDTSTAGTSQSPGRIAIRLDRIDPGDHITVLYDVALATTVSAGTSVPNSVLVTGTSLPGPNGTPANPTGSTTPGASGGTTGERNGAGGAINDYRITAGTSVLIATPQIEKTIFDTSPVETQANQYDPNREDFAIGEIVTYRITVTLPEGRTPALVVSDVLPGGGRMKLFSENGVIQTRVVSVGANIVGAALAAGAPGVVGNGGGSVTFNLGTVTNNPDNVVDDNDRIVLEVQAQVMDVAANKAGGTITNVGNLTYTVNGTPVTTTDSVTSDIVEPVLRTTKEVQKLGDTGFVDLKKVDVGDTLVYRVTVQHAANSSGPAYSVRIADTLPAGLQLLGAPTVVYHPDYQSSFYDQPVVTSPVGGDPNAFSVLIDYLDHPDNALSLGGGDFVVIEYQALVTTLPPKGSIQNTAVVTYDSLYGERSSVISPDTTRDYRTTDPATVVVASNAISGYVYVDMNNDGVFDPGEDPIPGVPIRLTGRDNLGRPVDMTTTTDATGNYVFAGLIPSFPGTSYTLTQVTQPAGYADGKDTVGTVFTTGSPSALSGPDRFVSIVIPANGTTELGENWNFGERVETDLAITKTDGTAIYRPDSTTTYRITVTNNGVWYVSRARVVDNGPAGTTPIAWRLASTSGAAEITAGFDGTGTGVPLDTMLDLAPGASATFEFTVSIPPGTVGLLTNVATVDPPDGWVDKTPGNNTATDTDTDSQQTLVIGSDTGCTSTPFVRVIDPATGADLITPIQPYETNFRGGVRVTTGDIDADGVDEIIVAPGIGRPFEVKVYKQDGTPLPAYTTFPFGPRYTRGGEIASGNVDGIGGDDLIVSAGGQANVYLWQGGSPALSSTPAQSFRPFGSFAGDVTLATGDFGRMSGGAFTKSPDGRFEIVTGTGLGARAQVRVYDVTGAATLVRQIQPIGVAFTGGVSVSTGRFAKPGVADDGVDDVVVSAGFGGNSVVEVYDVWSKPLSTTLISRDAVARASAFAGLARPQAAVHAAALTDASGNIDIYGVQGSGGFGSTNGLRRLGTLSGPQVKLNSLAAPLRIAAVRK